MKFSEIHGNKALAENLVKMVDTKRLGHAILFSEQEGQGALAFAIALSQYINCSNPSGGDSCGECLSCRKHYRLTHPDLHFAFPVNASSFLSDSEKKKPVSSYFMPQWNDLVQRNPYFTPGELSNALGLTGKVGNISVNEAREISDALALHSSESDYKVMIIWQAEKMNAEASNKLLKLLEEPPQGTLFILITQQSEQLLQTIRSRCQLIPLQPVQQGEMAEELTATLGMDKAEAMEVAALSSGSWGKALELVSQSGADEEFLPIMEQLIRSALAKSLDDVLAVSEQLASMGKEQQRRFCLYAGSYTRKLFMTANGLPDISFAKREEREFLQQAVSRIRPAFYRKTLDALDTAIRSIDANVLAKLVFTDLCNRFYLNI